MTNLDTERRSGGCYRRNAYNGHGLIYETFVKGQSAVGVEAMYRRNGEMNFRMAIK